MAAALDSAVHAIEKQDALDKAAESGQQAVAAVFDATGGPGQAVKNALHGVWLGHPLHPAVIPVPVGAWSAAGVLDLLEANGERRYGPGADALVTIGLVGAGIAAMSGLADWQHTHNGARRLGLVHGMLNTVAAVCYGVSLVLRGRGRRRAGRTAAFTGLTVAMASAYLGGELAYKHRVGMNHQQDAAPPEEFTNVLPSDELPEGSAHRAKVHGAHVVLVREEGQVYALGESCSHMGGPLSEGKVVDGCIECPWHGSRFSLRDGHVVDGPATYPQASYEVRVERGQIAVRRRPE